jgi:hypothetical protein
MLLNQSQNTALHHVLQHYIGGQITSIFPIGDSVKFNTLLGQKGEFYKNEQGDWSIVIDNQEIEKIENEVFKALITPESKNNLEDYLGILYSLVSDTNLRYRSAILVKQILKILESYAILSDFVPEKSLKVGSFTIFRYKKDKFVYSLN